MCGIFGAVSLSASPLQRPEIVEAMGRSLQHRGPDRHCVLAASGGAIGTERLRIIDLDPRADQPFASKSGTWLACNGEIYNYRELRERFVDYEYQSLSDVETILPMFLAKGNAAIDDLDGMFGLALWNEDRRELLLARDRAGEKPLFYARVGDEVWFASEVQALLQHPQISRELDREAASQFLDHGFILEPLTIFRSIRRIASGSHHRFTTATESKVRYWEPERLEPLKIRERDAIEELKRLLRAAVHKQLVSDVPVGVFVSGGLDSALLLHLAVRETGHEHMQSFSVGFEAESYDESSSARRVSARYGSPHRFVTADEASLLQAFDQVIERVAEPVSDPAILPTVLLARMARQHVTVSLGGEGADELFGGYPTFLGHSFAPRFAALPGFVRASLAGGVRLLPTSNRKVPLEFLLKKFMRTAELPWKQRHAAWFGTGLPHDAFVAPPDGTALSGQVPDSLEPLLGAMLLDYKTYLRDNLLVKIDRATMLSSLEGRAPFLDRDLTRFAFQLPSSMKVRGFTTKWILKQVAEEWLPKEIVHQRKRGLSVPIADWMNHGLRDRVDQWLTPSTLEEHGLVRPDVIAEMLAEHRGGKANHARALWPVIVLHRWMGAWGVEA